MKIKILDNVVVDMNKVNHLPITEFSDIAWDHDEQILYAVSDEGILYHLRFLVKNNKIKTLKVVKAARLKAIDNTPLRNKYRDAEGLSLLNAKNGVKGDTQLIISFEVKPRIARFSTQGKQIINFKIPKKISKKKYFRHKNNALESVTHHPKYGVLTAAEHPIKHRLKSLQTIYASNGKEWSFRISPDKNSAITALEILPNNDILVLERAYTSPFTPIIINLRRVKLEQCDSNNICETETLAHFNGIDGWNLDNFEGLARINDTQYLMVSDDNGNPLQTTIWVLFEVNPTN